MTEDDQWVNATTDTETPKWNTIGANPWLDTNDTSYIDTNVDGRKSGDYSFPNSGGSGTIDSVFIRMRDRRSLVSGLNNYDVYLYDGSSWQIIASGLIPSNTFFMDEIDIDVSAILNTWTKINSAQIYVVFHKFGTSTVIIYVSQCIRIVNYTVSAVQTCQGDGLVWTTY